VQALLRRENSSRQKQSLLEAISSADAHEVYSFIASFVLLSAAPVLAQHSAAGVDTSQTLLADATLKQFAWSAAHAQIIVTYQDESGKDVELSVLTFTPALLINQGFSPKDFRRGDKIKLFWHPNRNSSSGGILSEIIDADMAG